MVSRPREPHHFVGKIVGSFYFDGVICVVPQDATFGDLFVSQEGGNIGAFLFAKNPKIIDNSHFLGVTHGCRAYPK